MPRQHDQCPHQRPIRPVGLARIVQQRRRQHIRSIDTRAFQIVHHLHAVPLQITRQRVKPRARRRIQHRVGFAPIFIGYPRENAAEELPSAIKESQIPSRSFVSAVTTGVTTRLITL